MNNTNIMKLFCILLLMIFFSCAPANKEEILKNQAKAIREVGVAYMQESNFSAALRELHKAELIYSNDPDLYNNLGLAYMAKKKLDLAVQYFKKAITLDPNYTAARNNLGTAYLAQENWDTAIETFLKVNEDLMFTTPHFPMTNLGWAYYNKGQLDIAEKYYKEALEHQPKYVIALRGLARIYTAKGDFIQALNTLDKALELAPRFPPLYMDLADLYTASSNHKEAVETYKKVIALFPDTEYSEQAKKKTGEMYLNLGN
ncbi:Tetratricopeptide repeat-containing protein [Desulfonema limicola]|uniref:Tetratricopeptide repeat-containing protein n=1 Tax=Desulfonema limicola TaxID=45656 RepID=A0A975GKG4_9BACT|nr:tetratricopeptide repeat protein [Desulfonema limicola]QTA83773.1 Tetratricopeptide repeat-containing protein [Desulfonema limicola]